MSRLLNFIRLLGLALIPLIFLGFYASAQTITKNITSPVSGTVCPNISTSYSVSIPSNFGTCKIKWTVTNGVINGLDNQQNVLVTWNDTPGATATITVTFSGCASGNPNEGVSRSKNELILSIKDQEWGPYNNSVNLDYCIRAQVNVTVPRMFVQGTGGVAQPRLTEVIYGWTIPAGWQIAGTTKTGFYATTVNYISIEPTKCSVPGTVKVQGLINDASLCGSAGPSKIATISLNGSTPVATISPQAGYSGASLCNTNPVTFYATTNGVFNCISSYNWSYSTSWTKLSQTGNSITLRPSGSPSDASSIGATINFSCGSSISASYTPTYAQNILTGPAYLCTSGLFSVTNSSGVPITWSSSNSSIATINSLGEATRVGSANGAVTITATFPCSAPPLPINIWVGTPNQPLSLSTSVSDLCVSSIKSISINPVPGASGYSWVSNNTELYVQNTNTPNSMISAEYPGDFSFTITAINVCDINSRTYAVTADYCNPQDCGVYPLPPCDPLLVATFPNPTQDQLTISLNEEYTNHASSLDLSIELIDSYGLKRQSLKSKNSNINIDTKDLPKGLYYLKIDFPKGSIVRHIIK